MIAVFPFESIETCYITGPVTLIFNANDPDALCFDGGVIGSYYLGVHPTLQLGSAIYSDPECTCAKTGWYKEPGFGEPHYLDGDRGNCQVDQIYFCIPQEGTASYSGINISPGANIAETAGAPVFTLITRYVPTGTTVDYVLTGSAQEGIDYPLAPGTITITGPNTQFGIGDIYADGITEGLENIILTLHRTDSIGTTTNRLQRIVKVIDDSQETTSPSPTTPSPISPSPTPPSPITPSPESPSPTPVGTSNYRLNDCSTGFSFNATKSGYVLNVGDTVVYTNTNTGATNQCGTIIDTNYISTNTDATISETRCFCDTSSDEPTPISPAPPTPKPEM